MAGHTLTTTATLQCPHGGLIQVISANTRTRAQGAPMATERDRFVVTGCPFQISGAPSPCLRVQWYISDARVKVNQQATVSRSSTGVCLSAAGAPQGPVVVVQTQNRVQSM